MLRVRRTLLALGLVLAGASSVSQARADDSKVRCAAAYEQGQELRRQDKLAASRTELSICEQTCPRALAADCTKWQTEVLALMPTVRLRARNREGHPVSARVLMDGAPLTEQVTDAALPVDSGEHTFRFESAEGVSVDVHASLHAGERGKEVVAVLGALSLPAAAPPTAATSRPMPTATYVFGAIGLAGLGLGAALSSKGHVDASHLESTCAPACSPSDVNAISTLYTVGWVSAGVGLASVAAGLVVWRPWEHASQASAQRMFVSPQLGGATLGVSLD